MRRTYIAGNWKMHKTPHQAGADFRQFAARMSAVALQKDVPKALNLDLAIAAPAVHLAALGRAQGPVALLAQNVHWEKEGAFTGEISTLMLRELGVQGSLVAHSERRQMCGETDLNAGKRMGALLRCGQQAILCVGETLAEREGGKLEEVLRRQLHEAFRASGVRLAFEFLGADASRPLLSIAYEPVWAIGTGKAATPLEAEQAHAFIRAEVEHIAGSVVSSHMRILYGGSVNPGNVKSFMACPDVDGALVGGASLNPAAFEELCLACLDQC